MRIKNNNYFGPRIIDDRNGKTNIIPIIIFVMNA